MMKKVVFFGLAWILAACGTAAAPVYRLPTATPELPAGEVVAVAATATPLPPTATPLPPTAVPTLVPTTAPTDVPAAVPTVQDPLEFFVSLANPASGQQLFNQNFDTPSGSWQCATCHNIEGDAVKIGPSLYGIAQRAITRVPDQGQYTYIYHAIRYSQEYLVPEFAAENMTRMPNYDGLLTDAQLYDLIAYLMTLQ